MENIVESKRRGRRIWWQVRLVLIFASLAVVLPYTFTTADISQERNMPYNKLTPDEENVIVNRGTEKPFSGKYYQHSGNGTYNCKRCDAPLYRSDDKFDAQCGWPSFDDEIPRAVKHRPDADGRRTEIVCKNCGGHLGHVFNGEQLTEKNVRHCVNSVSLNFVAADQTLKTEKAYFAAGCFWGVEYLMQKAEGVISTRVGYMGGKSEKPTYEEVCSGKSGHAETVEVEFDRSLTSFETLARLFFEIHDPTQIDRQGPDIGSQYRSHIFYVDENQKEVAEKLIGILTDKGFEIATRLSKAAVFGDGEDYHQDYYLKNGNMPYCHAYEKRF